jgi:hypothetical protein
MGRISALTHSRRAGKSSPIRLLLIAVVLVGFAFGSWGLSLFFRGATNVKETGKNFPEIFIPVWVGMTITTVVVSFWFAKRILTAEKSRDSETVSPASPAHSH